MSTESWCHPTISSSVVPFSSCPQTSPASGFFPVSQLFMSGGQSIGVFSFNISPSNEYSGLISFSMDWLDLFAVQGTLKSLLQHHSSKAPILQCSVFFIVQLSHPYMTTGKTIAFTRWTSVGKVLSLLFNMLSRYILIPKLIELYPLSMYSFLHVNHTSNVVKKEKLSSIIFFWLQRILINKVDQEGS